MKLIQFTLLVSLFAINIFGQEDYVYAKIYLSKGEVIKDQINPNFASSTDVKVYLNNKKRTYQKRKIDSILMGQEKYFTKKSFLITDFLKKIDDGIIEIFEVNGRLLGIKRKNSELFIIPKLKYDYAYNIFCSDSVDKEIQGINKENFITKIEKYNSSTAINSEIYVLFDSIRESSRTFLTRLSFFRPEVGFEIKLSKEFTLYNSIGLNFFGDIYRGVQTIVNYDYSGEIRLYYNNKKRLEQGRSNYNFSGPFIAATYKYMIENNEKNKNIIGIIHGWQDNNIFKSLYSGYRIGIGFNPIDNEIMVMSFLTMGWSF